jgi:hypothetical protein
MHITITRFLKIFTSVFLVVLTSCRPHVEFNQFLKDYKACDQAEVKLHLDEQRSIVIQAQNADLITANQFMRGESNSLAEAEEIFNKNKSFIRFVVALNFNATFSNNDYSWNITSRGAVIEPIMVQWEPRNPITGANICIVIFNLNEIGHDPFDFNCIINGESISLEYNSSFIEGLPQLDLNSLVNEKKTRS